MSNVLTTNGNQAMSRQVKAVRQAVALAYLRVSTDEQCDSKAGLAAQADAVRACAARLGLELADDAIFADDQNGVSSVSSLEDRPVLLEAISKLGKGDVLIVAKRDRIGRDPICIALIEAAVQRCGARIVSAAGEGTEGDSPTDIMMRRMVDAFGEYERLVIRARTKAAMGAMKRRGERTGSIPFGKRLSDDGVHLVTDPAEAEVIRLVVALRATGLSLAKIASRLNADNTSTKEGGRWGAEQVKRVLTNAA